MSILDRFKQQNNSVHYVVDDGHSEHNKLPLKTGKHRMCFQKHHAMEWQQASANVLCFAREEWTDGIGRKMNIMHHDVQLGYKKLNQRKALAYLLLIFKQEKRKTNENKV